MSETSIITNARRELLCKITSGAVSTIPKITKIAFGSGGLDGSGNPVAPSESQTKLNQEIAQYPIDGVEYPINTTARYTATIPRGDLAGKKISEAALVDASGTLCAIKTMYPKQKDADVVFIFTFDDEF